MLGGRLDCTKKNARYSKERKEEEVIKIVKLES